jgi:hypothetical protein
MVNILNMISLEIALTAILATLIGCGKSQQQTTIHPNKEAYRLLDQGKSALAIYILEESIARNPDNSEARMLLSSAYVGEAGVDVFKIYDTFKDVIFDKPLSKRFWPSQASESTSDSSASKNKTKIELFVSQLDSFLLTLSRVVSFLGRFPDVEKAKWVLLDRALENLELVDSTKDICLYRVFIRIIYLRAYLSQELMKNANLGSRSWACNLELEHMREALAWIMKNLINASEDFQKVDFGGSHSLAEFQGAIQAILDALEEAKSNAPVGVNSGYLGLQNKLREAFHCE